jgi:hypothetical protein
MAAALKAKFAEVDKDGSGMITQDEFKALLKQGNPKIDDKSVMTVWSKLDSDGSGKLSFEELANYLGNSSEKMEFKNPGMSPACQTFCDVFKSLTYKNDEGRVARGHAFAACDPNGNGYVSLAEVDGWIQKVLITYFGQKGCDGDPKEEGTRIWKCFRASYIRAHTDAKDIAGGGSRADDYVTAKEFRLLCAYLILYAAMYDAFALIDGGGGSVEDKSGDDRKMTLAEWKKGYKTVAKHGFVGLRDAAKLDEKGAEEVFKKMNSGKDAEGKEYGNDSVVMLAEFCAWVEKCEVAAKTPWGEALGA